MHIRMSRNFFIILLALILIMNVLLSVNILISLRSLRMEIGNMVDDIEVKVKEQNILVNRRLDDLDCNLLEMKTIVGKSFDELKEVLDHNGVQLSDKLNYIVKMESAIADTNKHVDKNVLYVESFLEKKESEAYEHMLEGNYGVASRLFSEVVSIDPARIPARYYWVYCVFYSNPLDKDKYGEILSEISFLRGTGMSEKSLRLIEDFIVKEQKFFLEKEYEK